MSDVDRRSVAGSPSPLAIGVLISGAGSTLENLAARIEAGRLRGLRIALVVSSRGEVAGCDIARRHGLPLAIIRRRDHADEAAFSDAITAALRAAGVDIVAMAGFLCFWRIPAEFAQSVVNIHPALLPAFGGRGMHGLNVHRAVLASGVAESGCTVHIADNEYDHGPILAQRRVPVLPGDTPELLAARVGAAERELYPEVLQKIADGRVTDLRHLLAGQ